MVNVDLYSAIITEVSNVLNTLVSGEKPGFQDLSKRLIVLLLLLFNCPFSRTTWVSQYRECKTSMNLNEARDDGVMGCSGISWTICKQSAPHSKQITTPTVQHVITQFFTGWMLFLMPNQQCRSTEGNHSSYYFIQEFHTRLHTLQSAITITLSLAFLASVHCRRQADICRLQCLSRTHSFFIATPFNFTNRTWPSQLFPLPTNSLPLPLSIGFFRTVLQPPDQFTCIHIRHGG